jgi:hypothetical protein
LHHVALDALAQGVVGVVDLGGTLADVQEAVVAAPAVVGGDGTVGFAAQVASSVPAVAGGAGLAVDGLGEAVVAVVLVAGAAADVAAQDALGAVA